METTTKHCVPDAPDGWRIYHASEAGMPDLHGVAAGERGDWHYEPVDGPDGVVWSSGYPTRGEALNACEAEAAQLEADCAQEAS